MPASALTDRIAVIVGGFLTKRGVGEPVELDRDLREAGLSSLDLVNLMLAVEGEFDIFIPEDQMTPENFSSIQAIDVVVASLIAA